MTSKAAENGVRSLPGEGIIRLFDGWLDAKGPVALRLRQRLLPVEADEDGHGVIFPPTYPGIGYNIDTLADGTRVATIDTVGSQANRLEPIFKSTGRDEKGEELNPLANLVPQIEILLRRRTAVKKGRGKEAELGGGSREDLVEKRSILELAHRSADAVVLASPTLAGEVANAFAILRSQGNAAPLCALAPTSLVFGVWDSRGGSGEKRPRLVRSIIRAWDVEILHSAAQFNSVWKALSEEEKQELEKEARAKKVRLSEKGLADASAIFRKTRTQEYRDGVPDPDARVLGGVLARGPIERDVTVNLVALRGLRGGGAEESRQVQQYLASLALLAATADLELFLREGCLLRYAGNDVWSAVPRRGDPTIVSLPEQGQLVSYATRAAEPFKEKWPKDGDGRPLALEHEFNLSEAKKLLARRDEDVSAGEQG